MPRLKPIAALALALGVAAAGCLARPKRPDPHSEQPEPAPPGPRRTAESALARGPALRLDDAMLDGEQSVLVTWSCYEITSGDKGHFEGFRLKKFLSSGYSDKFTIISGPACCN